MPKLVYFPLGGRAEMIRFLLIHAKVQFEDIRLSFPEFGAAKGEGKYAEGLPVYISDDGHEMNQSNAILRALGREHGYYGGSTQETYEVDYIMENITDMGAPTFTVFMADEVTPEAIKTAVETIDWYLGVFEKKLAGHGKTYLTGEKITIADFALFAFISMSALNKGLKHADVGEGVRNAIAHHPHLKAWSTHLEGLFQEYLDARTPSWC